MLFTLIGIIALSLYREAPSLLASRTSGLQRASIRDSLKLLKENRSTLLATLSLSVATAVILSFEFVMEAAFRHYGATTLYLRNYSIISTPFVVLFTIGASVFSGKSGSFKSVVLSGNFSLLILIIGFLFLYKLSYSLIFGSTLILLSSITGYQSTVGIEFLA